MTLRFTKCLNFRFNFFQALEITLQAEDQSTKTASVDILLYIVEFLPAMVREYMLQQLNSSDDVSSFYI